MRRPRRPEAARATEARRRGGERHSWGPARGALVLGVDEQRDAADIIGDADPAIGGARQESAAQSAALHRLIDGEAASRNTGTS